MSSLVPEMMYWVQFPRVTYFLLLWLVHRRENVWLYHKRSPHPFLYHIYYMFESVEGGRLAIGTIKSLFWGKPCPWWTGMRCDLVDLPSVLLSLETLSRIRNAEANPSPEAIHICCQFSHHLTYAAYKVQLLWCLTNHCSHHDETFHHLWSIIVRYMTAYMKLAGIIKFSLFVPF
jgi:hypothetical protein